MAVIRGFFEILSDNVLRDNSLIFYALCHLDGILEDSRVRVKYYVDIMNDFKNAVDLIKILVNFITKTDRQPARDIASHILVLLIDASGPKCESDAKHFLAQVTQHFADGINKKNTKDEPFLSLMALSFALFTLVKTNSLAKELTNPLGYKILNEFLETECLQNAQIAYHIVGCLWILSYHDEALTFFQDYSQGIIEKVSKILDFFSWEKIVRIMLMLFDNLKDNSICQEHMSDIDALSLIVKL